MIAPAAAVDAVYDGYRAVLAEHRDQPPAAWTFKGDPRYRRILEHVDPEHGDAYLALIRATPGWNVIRERVLMRTAQANDRLGGPIRAPSSLGIDCSPTNLRYAWQAVLLEAHLARLRLWAADVIELGAGYGGLALYLDRLLPRGLIRSHTLVDVPEAAAIQAAFCRQHRLSPRRVRMADGTNGESLAGVLAATSPARRALVSCYAFSEFGPAMRDWYAARLLRHCPHGFMVWNGKAVTGTVPYAFTDAPLTVEDERPLTAPGNKVLTW